MPLRAANVVVLRVAVVNTRFTDPAGNPVPETQMVGTGEALVATGGRTLAVTWTKNSPGEPVVLTGADGQPVLLAPGQHLGRARAEQDGLGHRRLSAGREAQRRRARREARHVARG